MKMIFYLYKSGVLKRKDNSVILEGRLFNEYLPIEQLDMIIVFSEVTLNKRVLALLNQYDVSVLFYNFYGDYIGRFSPKDHKEGKVLVKQVIAYQTQETRLNIAKELTLGSMRNMQALIKYYRKKGKSLDRQFTALESCYTEAEAADRVEKLLLIEAKAKQFYYAMFDVVLESEPFHFEKRSKHPPENEVNAMLSYGYSILYGVVLSVLDRSSLHPQISFIHSQIKSPDALKYDIADVFKPMLVDRLVLRIIRKKQVDSTCFSFKEKRCYLNKKGAALFVSEFDSTLQKTILYGKRSYSYRSIISMEIHKISEFIKGNTEQLRMFTMKW